ncbi:TIGR03862 family flavoprotein [Achromobacter sp. GG226]|nr:TIGR03862 family flavoprotein [Verticiella sp. GG226]
MSAGHCEVAIIGAGPAGLMAAEICAQAGLSVHVFDGMPSAGRKFLLAGLGGLNITHSEPADQFLGRYASDQPTVAPWLQAFDAQALRAWVHALGVSTFVGSSGRVFPQEMKAAPLLRAWLARLRRQGVSFHMRHRLIQLSADRELTFAVRQADMPTATAASEAAAVQMPQAGYDPAQTQLASAATRTYQAGAVVLACGGASWPRLGSDGAWADWLPKQGVAVTPLQAANCGFEVTWSPIFLNAHAGAPVKNVRAWIARPHASGWQALCAPAREKCWSPMPASKGGWCTRCRGTFAKPRRKAAPR